MRDIWVMASNPANKFSSNWWGMPVASKSECSCQGPLCLHLQYLRVSSLTDGQAKAAPSSNPMTLMRLLPLTVFFIPLALGAGPGWICVSVLSVRDPEVCVVGPDAVNGLNCVQDVGSCFSFKKLTSSISLNSSRSLSTSPH